ncbi:MAG TPA: hypothetical protein VGH65_04840 [Verrucomicrobiaceae bacterium]|jgi:hypothetical protein
MNRILILLFAVAGFGLASCQSTQSGGGDACCAEGKGGGSCCAEGKSGGSCCAEDSHKH